MKKYVVMVVVLVASCMVASANLLLNADFSSDGVFTNLAAANMTSWNHWGDSGYYQGDIGGNPSAKAWWDDSGIYQDFTATPGTVYALSVMAQQRTGDLLVNWHGYLKVEFYNALNVGVGTQELDYISSADPADSWVLLSGSSTSPVSTAYGRIVLGINNWAEGPSGAAYFDDASVDASVVPEPALAGLVLLGGLGLAMLRKRK
ncbi:MAG: PEP-CTERM sorting domain-containing protein [Verrucomicrobiota bacterium]